MTYEEIKQQVQKICDDKVEKERMAAQEKADNQIESLQRVFDMVENGMLFKKVNVYYSSYKKFVVADANDIAHDYQNKREPYDPDGIKFVDEKNISAMEYGIVCIINGHRYYSMERVLDGYDKQLQENVKLAYNAYQHAKERRNEFLDHIHKFPEIKEMIETYRAAKEDKSLEANK